MVKVRRDDGGGGGYTKPKCSVEEYRSRGIGPHHSEEEATVNASLRGVKRKRVDPSPAQPSRPSDGSGSDHDCARQLDIASPSSTRSVARGPAVRAVTLPGIDGQSVKRDVSVKTEVQLSL